MDAIGVIDALIRQESPHVRSALSKVGVLDLLIDHADRQGIGECLGIWSKNKRTHTELALHYGRIVDKLAIVEASADAEGLLAALARLHNSPCLFSLVSPGVRLAQASALLDRAWLVDPFAHLASLCVASAGCEATLSGIVDRLVASTSFRESLAVGATRVDAFVINVATRLGVYHPSAMRRLLKTVAPHACARFKRDRSDVALMPLVAPHVGADDYEDQLLDVCVLRQSILIDMMYAWSRTGLHFRLTKHPMWSYGLESILCEAIEATAITERVTTSSARACSVLLTISCVSSDVLSAEATSSLRLFLQHHPDRFAFESTDNEIVLHSIVAVGRRLGVPDAQLSGYMLDLDRVICERKRSERSAALGISLTLPDVFHCPITMEVMRDPVVASDGHTYEKASLVRILQQSNAVSPLTRETLDPSVLVPNLALRKRIRGYVDEMCEVVEEERAKRSRVDEHQI